jgi:hypothetical protein
VCRCALLRHSELTSQEQASCQHEAAEDGRAHRRTAQCSPHRAANGECNGCDVSGSRADGALLRRGRRSRSLLPNKTHHETRDHEDNCLQAAQPRHQTKSSDSQCGCADKRHGDAPAQCCNNSQKQVIHPGSFRSTVSRLPPQHPPRVHPVLGVQRLLDGPHHAQRDRGFVLLQFAYFQAADTVFSRDRTAKFLD